MNNYPTQIQLVDTNSPTQIVSIADITPYTALSIPAYSRAMTFLSDNMASFPRSVRKMDVDGGSTQTPHAMDELLSLQPNTMQDAFTFWSTAFFHTAHAGNGYAEIVRDRAHAEAGSRFTICCRRTCCRSGSTKATDSVSASITPCGAAPAL